MEQRPLASWGGNRPAEVFLPWQVGNLVFDASGKYLYFAASTDSGPGNLNNSIDLSAINRPQTKSLYLAVLDKDQESPLAPESDEEKQDDKKPAPGKDKSIGADEKLADSASGETKEETSPDKAKKQSGIFFMTRVSTVINWNRRKNSTADTWTEWLAARI